jgi:Helix-turn-helix domain of resolvase
VARPTKLTPAKQSQIVKLLEAGNYRETVCGACAIGTSTLYRWLERGAVEQSGIYYDFRVAVERAEAVAEAEAVAVLRSAIVEGDWRATLAYLERRHGERWGRRQTNQIVGPGGGPLRTEQLLRLDPSRFSDEELELIRSLWERGVAENEREGPE